jgi:polar amino acid transport system substrate-binding protein
LYGYANKSLKNYNLLKLPLFHAIKGNMKRVLAIFFFLVVICPISRADNYFFVSFEYPPLSYENKNEIAMGIFVQMVSDIMANLGHDVKIEVLPWTRALSMVRKGEADAIFTAYKNDMRESFLDYSKQVLFPQEVFFYKAGTLKFSFNGDLKTLENKRIGVVSTISYGKIFDSYKSNLMIEKANKLEHNFNKLLSGRLDLVPSHSYVADYMISKMGFAGKISKLPQRIDIIPSYIAFSKIKKLNHLIEQFDNELVRMKEIGEYSKIINSFNGHNN